MTEQFPAAPGPAMMDAGSRTPATFGQRLIAVLIDGFISTALTIPGFVAVMIGAVMESVPVILIGALLLFLAMFAVFYILLVGIGTEGQTPGKRMQGVQVVSDSGEMIGIGGSIVRYVVQSISNTVFYLGGLWMLFDPDKKTLYDKVLDNRAVQVPKGGMFPIFPGAKPF